MAGANYEVNIQLKADPALRSLERIEQKINKLTKTSVDLQDARGAAMVKNRNLADRINKLEEKGVKVTKMRERLSKAIAKTDKGSLQTAAAHEKILRREVKNEERLLRVKKDQLKVDQQQTRRRGPGRGQSAILGGGFPLLFGGSPVSALGGAVGGALGGFGGGIAGQIIADRTLGSAARLGQALNELTFDLEEVVGAAGFAGTETAQLLERIEQYGDAAVAADLATKLLKKRIGEDGVQALKDFGDTANQLGSALSTIFTQVLAKIAEVAGPLLSSLAKFAGEQADVGAFLSRTGLKGEAKLAQEILGATFQTRQGELTSSSSRALAGFSRRNRALGGQGFATAAEARKFATDFAVQSQRKFELPTIKQIEFEASQVKDPSETRDANRAERLLASSEKRISLLRIETNAVRRISGFKDRIAAAELAGDKQTAARIQGEQKIFELGVQQEKAILRINSDLTETQRQKEVIGIQEKTNAQIAEVNADTQRKIAKIIGEDQLKAIKEQEKMYKQIGDIVKGGLVDGIQSAIRGTKSLSEALSNMLNRLSDKFMDLAANLALYGNSQGNLQSGMGIFGTIFKAAIPALIPGGGGSTTGPNVDLIQQYMADGGFVNKPTSALIGEGGQGEYVIPESKMRESMARYSRGARGASVLPDAGASGTTGEGGGTALAAPIDVRYTVERINSVDYVTADQFQAGMRQAANQGAKQGEQQTLKRLQMSSSTRKRIGM